MGQAAAFSFYPGKNLGACGEGWRGDNEQRTRCEDDAHASRSRPGRRSITTTSKDTTDVWTLCKRESLSVKLRHLADWNRKRRAAANKYDEMLSSVEGVTVPQQPEWSRSVYHLYVVPRSDRDGLQKHLADAKIDTGIHYPMPLHLQQAYKHFGSAG